MVWAYRAKNEKRDFIFFFLFSFVPLTNAYYNLDFFVPDAFINVCVENVFLIDSIRIPRQSWDEYALIMNARLMRGTCRQEDNKYEKTAAEFAEFKETF